MTGKAGAGCLAVISSLWLGDIVLRRRCRTLDDPNTLAPHSDICFASDITVGVDRLGGHRLPCNEIEALPR